MRKRVKVIPHRGTIEVELDKKFAILLPRDTTPRTVENIAWLVRKALQQGAKP